jgi:hypothetical protein
MIQINNIISWCNYNAGFLSIVLFISTILLAWASGLFKAILRKPKFKISTIEGPTFCSTLLTGFKYGEYDIHKTAFSLYLKISNIGYVPSSIDRVEVGYHWNINRINNLWFRYCIGWCWVKQSIVKNDFTIQLDDETTKVYPFLIQEALLQINKNDTYVTVGKCVNGIVYFEQSDSYGGCSPKIKNNKVKIKIRIFDIYQNKYSIAQKVPMIDINEARKYCPSFGESIPKKQIDSDERTKVVTQTEFSQST